jgi:hypothetical protein
VPLPATLLLLYRPDEIVPRQLVVRPETDGLLTGPDAFVPVRLELYAAAMLFQASQ